MEPIKKVELEFDYDGMNALKDKINELVDAVNFCPVKLEPTQEIPIDRQDHEKPKLFHREPKYVRGNPGDPQEVPELSAPVPLTSEQLRAQRDNLYKIVDARDREITELKTQIGWAHDMINRTRDSLEKESHEKYMLQANINSIIPALITDRSFLQSLRETARGMCSEDPNPCWVQAYEALWSAVDRLDAMQARTQLSKPEGQSPNEAPHGL